MVTSTTLGTITGAVAGKMVALRIDRLGSDAGDTYTGVASVDTTYFITVEIEYTSSI